MLGESSSDTCEIQERMKLRESAAEMDFLAYQVEGNDTGRSGTVHRSVAALREASAINQRNTH